MGSLHFIVISLEPVERNVLVNPNKAVYTAYVAPSTSRQKNGHGWMDRQMDGPTDRWTDRPTNTPSCRVASSQLRTIILRKDGPGLVMISDTLCPAMHILHMCTAGPRVLLTITIKMILKANRPTDRQTSL